MVPLCWNQTATTLKPFATLDLMQTWIALLRGINVGGHNILPMAKLKRDLETLQLHNVRTYIQSGNCVFSSTIKTASTLSEKIENCIEEHHGFRPQLLLLRRKDLRAAIAANPFPEAASDPKTLHFFFLAEPASSPNMEALEEMKSSTERFQLTSGVFYLHAPDGIGRSKLAASAARQLGVVTTGRNYRTVEKLWSMVAQG